jgi:hypothetical protein
MEEEIYVPSWTEKFQFVAVQRPHFLSFLAAAPHLQQTVHGTRFLKIISSMETTIDLMRVRWMKLRRPEYMSYRTDMKTGMGRTDPFGLIPMQGHSVHTLLGVTI